MVSVEKVGFRGQAYIGPFLKEISVRNSQLFNVLLCKRIKQFSHIQVDLGFFVFQIINMIFWFTSCQSNFESSVICYFFNLTYCLHDLVSLNFITKHLLKFNQLIVILLLFFFLSRYRISVSIIEYCNLLVNRSISFRSLILSKGTCCLLNLIDHCL